MQEPLSLRSYPRAIIHVDADSFFASCEQAVDPSLRGKPVITGRERGIASAVSLEAKRYGIKRGMSIREIKELCPDVIYVPSDYETYSLFSKRMFSIVRRYTSLIEEYSIDECFAEITGLRRSLRGSYEEIAERIRTELEAELGITFSLGLGPSKVVAKIGSKYNKPSGFMAIPGRRLHEVLATIPVSDVWGIGTQTTHYLRQFGIASAFDYAKQDQAWINEHMAKPYRQIWHELRGESVLPIETQPHTSYQSISKTKTFTPPSSDRAFVFSQLSKNIENACIKARRYHLGASRIYILLRTQQFRHRGMELPLSAPTFIPNEIISVADAYFDTIFRSSEQYRLTGIVLSGLQDMTYVQTDLFGESVRAQCMKELYAQIDRIDGRFGKHTVYLGSSHQTLKNAQHSGMRNDAPRRSKDRFRGEGKRQRLGLPLLGDVS